MKRVRKRPEETAEVAEALIAAEAVGVMAEVAGAGAEDAAATETVTAVITAGDGGRASACYSFQPAGFFNLRKLLLKCSEISKHLLAVFAGVDFHIFFRNNAIRTDQEGVPCGEFHHSEVHHGSVGRGNMFLRVGEQFKVQAFFRTKLLVRVRVLHAYAKDDCVFRGVPCQVALEIVRFDGAPTREIFWIEIQHDPFAAKIVQAYLCAVL